MSGNNQDQIRKMISAHRALAILRLLSGKLLGTANEYLLHDLIAILGLRTPRKEMRELLEFLERAGTISTTLREELLVVEITHRGQEVAKGLVDVEGIEKPGSECPY